MKNQLISGMMVLITSESVETKEYIKIHLLKCRDITYISLYYGGNRLSVL